MLGCLLKTTIQLIDESKINPRQKGKINMSLKSLTNETLTEKLRDLSKRDLRLTAEIVSHIHEFMIRRLFLDHGSTSIFGYLTDQLGYPRATAQNRIDAARLLDAVPEVKEDLANGKINLGQITLISMGVRQVEKENPGTKVSNDQKRHLVEKLANTSTAKSDNVAAQVVAQELNIKIDPVEKVRVHQDGSVTIEVHLSKEEFENLKRVRDLNTHKNHNAKLGETVAEAAKFFLEKKDPRKLKTKIELTKSKSDFGSDSNLAMRADLNPTISSDSNLKAELPKLGAIAPKQSFRNYISVHVVRALHQRDRSCRWKDSKGHVCGSTYQLQIDHIKGLADGGTDSIENLELKCAIHNRRKFELERLALRKSGPK